MGHARLSPLQPPNEQWRRYGHQEPNYVRIAGAAVLLLV